MLDNAVNLSSAMIKDISNVALNLGKNPSVLLQVNTSGESQKHGFLPNQIDEIQIAIKEMRVCLVSQSEKNIEVLVPGYTHLQRAQPVFLSHHLIVI